MIMNRTLLTSVLSAVLLSQPSLAIASKVINVTCEQTEFQSRNQYLSKDLGYDLGTKSLYLDYSNPNRVILQTDMGILVDNEVIFLEENGAEISLLTATDHLNYSHHFNLNRSNGNVSVVRFHESDETRREISIFNCKTSKYKF